MLLQIILKSINRQGGGYSVNSFIMVPIHSLFRKLSIFHYCGHSKKPLYFLRSSLKIFSCCSDVVFACFLWKLWSNASVNYFMKYLASLQVVHQDLHDKAI